MGGVADKDGGDASVLYIVNMLVMGCLKSLNDTFSFRCWAGQALRASEKVHGGVAGNLGPAGHVPRLYLLA